MPKALLLVLSMFVLSAPACGAETGKMGDDEDSGTGDEEDAGDTDTGEDCGPQEITDDSTDITWKRCHAGGWWEWNGTKCTCQYGLTNIMTWDEIGDACDPGWRPAAVDELMGVLEGCDAWADIEADGSGSCENCPGSEPCATLFPNDGRIYWSATEANDAEAYTVWFNVGTVAATGKGVTYYVRCVEE